MKLHVGLWLSTTRAVFTVTIKPRRISEDLRSSYRFELPLVELPDVENTGLFPFPLKKESISPSFRTCRGHEFKTVVEARSRWREAMGCVLEGPAARPSGPERATVQGTESAEY